MALVFEAKVGRNTPTLTVALTGPGHWPGSSKLPLHLSEARQRDKPRATLVDPSMPGAPRLSKDVRASQGAGRPGVHPCGTHSFPQGKGRNQGQVCCIQYDPHSVQYLVPTTTFRHRLKLWSIESLSWVAAPGKEKKRPVDKSLDKNPVASAPLPASATQENTHLGKLGKRDPRCVS